MPNLSREQAAASVGYDSKNAAHLIRLLRMGVEFLKDGDLRVARSDSEELLSIKRGEWPLDAVKAEAERLFNLAEKAYVTSPLPPEPDIRAAEALCTEIISDYHGW